MAKKKRIEKQTFRDIQDYLFNKFEEAVKDLDKYYWPIDFDSQYIYSNCHGITFRTRYYKNENKEMVFEGLEEVIRDTSYKPLSTDEATTLDDGGGELLRRSPKMDLAYAKKAVIPTIKQFQEEEQIAIEPMAVPPHTFDMDGEGFDFPTIEYMVKSFNKALEDERLQFHFPHGTPVDWFSVEKAWVNPVECYIGEEFVVEGQPIAKVKYHDKDKWEDRKLGEILGLSIGAQCTGFEVVEED